MLFFLLFNRKDFNYCGRHHPCLNDGVCTNSGPNDYTCLCQPGFNGRDCEEGEVYQNEWDGNRMGAYGKRRMGMESKRKGMGWE